LASATDPNARFLTGSTMRHVTVMASTGAIGLVAIFAVDLLNLLYISMLGQQPVAAAVGFAGTVGFFQVPPFPPGSAPAGWRRRAAWPPPGWS
jgi:hypothetical protein